MQTLQVLQGTPEWLAARAACFTASEAPIMMGASKYQTRNDLLKAKATGIAEEIEPAKQRLFDRGHAAEAAARPIVERMIGQELYPCTGVLTVEGLPLLASFDGLTMDEALAWENKLFNPTLIAAIRAGDIDPHYYWQLEQQMLVAGAEQVLFTSSDGTEENTVGMWYQTVPERRAALIAGWHQFGADLAKFKWEASEPAAVAAPTESLPAVSVQMNGSIAVISNLTLFGEKLNAFVATLDRNPSDDQAFANTEAAIKTLQKAQDALEQAESAALAQTSSIEEMRRTVALYVDIARTTRLMLEKMVKMRKESIRVEITTAARADFADHIASLNRRLGAEYMPLVSVDFVGAIKGKRTIESLHDAVDTEMARAKIVANEIADRISANLRILEDTGLMRVLFADFKSICTKAEDDFMALVQMRCAEHRKREEKRGEEMREKIRVEEIAKLERERVAQEQAAAAIAAAQSAPVPTPPAPQPMRSFGGIQVSQAQFDKTYPQKVAAMPDFRLGQIAERLGFSLTADFLTSLGFAPAARDRSAVLYRSADFPLICQALVNHIGNVCERLTA